MPDGESSTVHYTKASGNLIFDMNMTLGLRDIWVKDDHKTPHPEWSTFAGVVSRGIIIISLTYAALNVLPVFGADIKNAYLQAPFL